MPEFEQPLDSPTPWVAEHVQKYVETDGAEGHIWRGVPILLLTTVGRRSGRARRTALIYGRDSERFVIVGSRGGADSHPGWYLNLTANSEVRVQVGADKFAARARTASPEEKSRLWPMMAALFPPYEEYQAKTKRDIPVVPLERM